MATVFMTVYGKEGLRELAEQNLAKAHYLASKVPLKFSGPFFNEFVASTTGWPPEVLLVVPSRYNPFMASTMEYVTYSLRRPVGHL